MADRPGSVALGTNVRALRSSRGLTQVELAAKVGVTKGYVSRIEKGNRPVNADLLERLATALDVEVDVLDEGTVLETRSTAWIIHWRSDPACVWEPWARATGEPAVKKVLSEFREAKPSSEWRAVRVETIETVEVW